MLTFQQKIDIIASFPELQRKDVSLGRVNFHFEESVHDKKTVVYHLHPNGNGFVYAGLLGDVHVDSKGLVNIRDYSEEELRRLVARSIASLSGDGPADAESSGSERAAANRKPLPVTERWLSPGGEAYTLLFDEEMWYLYAGDAIDMAFESYKEALEYLAEEEFRRG
ncbi:hypothetical protein B1748_32765 [Paenibacillus sp. MY03]|jgi:hypothetical protein|uniref:Uncharacterized protein n=1 Tax=Paenibacillus agaridevorans TaxID=171404 RepID=A0A2R5EIF7_9BACL|nr:MULTISPECIES: hypothetical protein [Paenibacillus]OUS68853.1 hypothetical protein B1748_32765 [Paenibacillus sp. MY03]GBG06380.1 hypothetical protein PAT3040_00905 [Paenibacillus agaridevorans]